MKIDEYYKIIGKETNKKESKYFTGDAKLYCILYNGLLNNGNIEEVAFVMSTLETFIDYILDKKIDITKFHGFGHKSLIKFEKLLNKYNKKGIKLN